jgi:hypothetical protein
MKYFWSRFSDFVRLSLLQSFDILTNFTASFITMAEGFNWIRKGYELVTVRLQWNVKAPLLITTDGCSEKLLSYMQFSPPETPKSKWGLAVYDWGTKII